MKHFYFSGDGNNPVIEIEHGRIRVGCWYITIEAFDELSQRWLEFRNKSNKLRIQG
jgi:hypothetical protein